MKKNCVLRISLSTWLASLLVFSMPVGSTVASETGELRRTSVPSFAQFDATAKEGRPLSIVFFGGSLTWGANASDPQTTSYRGRMMEYLQNRYPKSSFTFHDAAIGGTGSSLGLFRLDRDVLRHNPNLVFLDFTANDDLSSDSRPVAVAYETILREMVGRGIPVVQAIFGFRFNFDKGSKLESLKRRTQHLQLAEQYQTALGDLFPLVQTELDQGKVTLAQLWPFDGAHPDDPGYALFFEAVRQGFEDAVADGRACQIPEKPVFGATYQSRTRSEVAKGTLPQGWEVAPTYRTSMWFDGLSSRWLSQVAVAETKNSPAPLQLEFEGTLVGLLGEADELAPKLSVRIDDQEVIPPSKEKDNPARTWTWDTSRFGKGRLFRWLLLSNQLTPGRHRLEVTPIFENDAKGSQFRMESVGSATLVECP